jgi:hypothetical protein
VIVVSGLQRVRPGAPVSPKKVSMSAQRVSQNETATQSASLTRGGRTSQEKSRDEQSRDSKARE